MEPGGPGHLLPLNTCKTPIPEIEVSPNTVNPLLELLASRDGPIDALSNSCFGIPFVLVRNSLTKQSVNVSECHSRHQCKPLIPVAFAAAIAPAVIAGGPVCPYVRGARFGKRFKFARHRYPLTGVADCHSCGVLYHASR